VLLDGHLVGNGFAEKLGHGASPSTVR